MRTELITAAINLATAIVTAAIGYYAGVRAERARERRARLQARRDEAYGPALEALAAMIHAHPACLEERPRLAELLRERGTLFTSGDVQFLRTALSEQASLDDLLEAHARLERAFPGAQLRGGADAAAREA